MLSRIKNITRSGLLLLASTAVFTACNKVPDVEDITPSTPSGQTIAEIISTDANYSILKAAATKAGVLGVLGNKNNKLTLFAPDNAAMARSGISEAVVGALPAAQLAAILSYHVVPQAIPSVAIPTLPYPNVQMPSLLQPLATQPLFKMSIFPSKRTGGAYVNNIPLTAVDKQAANGYIHTTYALVAPPQATLRTVIANDPNLSFLRAAIARADEGSTGLSRIDSLLNYAFPNITLFAPTDDAFKAALTMLGAPPVPQAFAALPVQTVRGILAYHILAINGTPTFRVFSPNIYTGTAETLLGPASSGMPPLTFDAANPMAPTVKGRVNPTASNIVAADIHGVNGVIHKVDQVLLPFLP